jgi:hypothetical protein
LGFAEDEAGAEYAFEACLFVLVKDEKIVLSHSGVEEPEIPIVVCRLRAFEKNEILRTKARVSSTPERPRFRYRKCILLEYELFVGYLQRLSSPVKQSKIPLDQSSTPV